MKGAQVIQKIGKTSLIV